MESANSPGTGREVGRVKALYRYPVKSMGSESLDTIQVGFHGFAGDRRWAFVRAGLERSGFPWLTIREKPEMWHYLPRFEEPERPDQSVTIVQTPSGDEFDVVDPALAAELGFGAHVIKQSVGIFDTFPLSLITTQTISSLGSMIGADLNRQRFRPNLLIEATTDEAFPEDTWVGALLQIGGMTMRIDKRDKRCVMINVDPVSNEKDARVLRAVAQERDGQLGVYGSTAVPGTVSVGDPVSLISA